MVEARIHVRATLVTVLHYKMLRDLPHCKRLDWAALAQAKSVVDGAAQGIDMLERRDEPEPASFLYSAAPLLHGCPVSCCVDRAGNHMQYSGQYSGQRQPRSLLF